MCIKNVDLKIFPDGQRMEHASFILCSSTRDQVCAKPSRINWSTTRVLPSLENGQLHPELYTAPISIRGEAAGGPSDLPKLSRGSTLSVKTESSFGKRRWARMAPYPVFSRLNTENLDFGLKRIGQMATRVYDGRPYQKIAQRGVEQGSLNF
ncbi:hypothetical protein CPLU01_11700 [Colletotrichum plurivorum]|uniref:Uncharacterized protein n=1 Tax=Colletotrichum plurivorum TaxID=2175906 RepID=A0A8H6N782_9PEZI|nr:hypothetical protein CPLU01_11700 [Colletotrichum plurivorum]